MQVNWMEIRSWLTLILAVVGGFIGIRQYTASQKQRRLENSFRMIALFENSLHEGDVEKWRKIFYASSELVGAKEGCFVNFNDDIRENIPLSSLFAEGSPDKGAIERMAEIFDLIGHTAKDQTVDLKVVYFQLGQIMDAIYSWLKTVNNPWGQKSFLEIHYPFFNYMYEKLKINQKEWPRRTYEHME
jgi:hypothetical protein